MTCFSKPPPAWGVWRHKTTDALIDAVAFYGEVLLTGGRSLLRGGGMYRSGNAHNCALYRLKKRGILVAHKHGRELISVELTSDTKLQRGYLLKPEQYWNRDWDGIWYVIMYDVPEKERSLRNSFRDICRAWKMGGLQKSVWVTPHDIRTMFNDLNEVSRLPQYSYLTAMRTVLGLQDRDIVLGAWDFDKLDDSQRWYLNQVEQARESILTATLTHADLSRLILDELEFYSRIMNEDPLLPNELLPEDYRGKQVVKKHRQFVKDAKKALSETTN